MTREHEPVIIQGGGDAGGHLHRVLARFPVPEIARFLKPGRTAYSAEDVIRICLAP